MASLVAFVPPPDDLSVDTFLLIVGTCYHSLVWANLKTVAE